RRGRQCASGRAEPEARRSSGRRGLRHGEGTDGLFGTARELSRRARRCEDPLPDPVMPEFDDKRAFVTGGSRGVGRAVCLELARGGADVAFVYRSRDAEAKDAEAQIRGLGRRALAIKTDLADARAVGAAAERVAAESGKIDVLV